MKKIIAVLLVCVLLLSLITACVNDVPITTQPNKPENETTTPMGESFSGESTKPEETKATEATLEKLNEKIYASSDFSEGLATVVCGSKNGRACVINKKGEIVFELDDQVEYSDIVSYCKFYNGYMAYNGGIWDKNGKVTYPEDVGATEFYYTTTLEYGYIFAEVLESDFQGTTKKLGVLNTDFKWVVEPNVELYASLLNEYGVLSLRNATYSDNYYFDEYVYIASLKKFVHITSGDVMTYKEVRFTHPSKSWQWSRDGTCRDYNSDIKVDLSQYDNLDFNYCTSFKNGISLVVFHNQSAQKSFFALINENGEFLFEPVGTQFPRISRISTDGETIVVNYGSLAKSYDMQGNLLATFDAKIIDKKISIWIFSINDGVIVVNGASFGGYYTPTFEPLF